MTSNFYAFNPVNLWFNIKSIEIVSNLDPLKNFYVSLSVNQLKSTKETNAVNIRIIETQHPRSPEVVSSSGSDIERDEAVQQGNHNIVNLPS